MTEATPPVYMIFTNVREFRVTVGESPAMRPGECVLAVQRRSGPSEISPAEKLWFLQNLAPRPAFPAASRVDIQPFSGEDE